MGLQLLEGELSGCSREWGGGYQPGSGTPIVLGAAVGMPRPRELCFHAGDRCVLPLRQAG